MTEDEPKQDQKMLNYENALSVAQADAAGWQNAQIWTLEDYLVRRTREQLSDERRATFDQRLKGLSETTLESLTALGNEYNLLADFDLQTESLMVYCRRNGIELSR